MITSPFRRLQMPSGAPGLGVSGVSCQNGPANAAPSRPAPRPEARTRPVAGKPQGSSAKMSAPPPEPSEPDEETHADACDTPHTRDAASNDFFLAGQRIPARRPEPGLYVVATPIGNLGDITLRALETLATADLIACEDTRVTAKLMRRYGLKTPLTAYHEHNAERAKPRLLAALGEGGVVALVSDAGTPLVSDPGYRLVRDVLAEGHAVIPLPGASAPLAALVGAGLATDTFCFAGFLPVRQGQRRSRLAELGSVPATLVFFESPRRVASTLADMAETFGPDRDAVVARELTKAFETFERGTLGELGARFADANVRGEIVIVVGPPAAGHDADPKDADALLVAALATMKPAGAAKEVARATGLDRKTLYARAMDLKSADRRDETP
jgi:16S rRNA (cytidine1402-2'-O)-methyltransferase